ncbi:MAG: tRNA (adenosine(37)-N6)-threonylcarbamoyltransferase complex ATPase subunit type 1 TsaE, partial [Actinobacteria bacterium]|nr:tRNA (adenosine(37)-N6)-threonylcarbamoyltransferase complex ATPase subunit type 1 TsaE [Actinomycetota bacterium]
MSTSPEQTRALGRAIAELARTGDVIALSGDLGAGKTVLAQGFVAGLGVDEPVVSPTFTLVRQYRGRLPVVHVDVYRLGHVQELVDLALDEIPGTDGVTIVEWGDRVAGALGAQRLDVWIERPPDDAAGAGDDARLITLCAFGGAWAARLSTLADHVDSRVDAVVGEG